MGLQDRVLPFSLALFLTSSMSHEDAAKVQVGFGKVSGIVQRETRSLQTEFETTMSRPVETLLWPLERNTQLFV